MERFIERCRGSEAGAERVRALEAAGDDDDRLMAGLLAALPELVGDDPGLIDDFADEVDGLSQRLGGSARLGWQVARLRARIEATDDDDVRERYSELLEEYGDDPAALARIRPLGRRIDELTREGRLPRALVRRGTWRRDEP